jgi:hypothetical protein
MALSRGSAVSLLAAVSLHAVLLWWVRGVPTAAIREASPVAPALEIVIEHELVEPLPPHTPTASEDPSPSPAARFPSTNAIAPRGPVGLLAAPSVATSPATPIEREPSPSAVVAPLVAAAPANAGVLSPRSGASAVASTAAPAVRFGLPLGSFSEGTALPGPRADRAPNAGPTPVDAARVFRDAADARDHALGVGFGGPVAAAGRAALSSPQAPVGGHGRYEVRADATGRVVSVRALDGDPAWQAFAGTLQAVLAGRTLRVPEGARGVVVVVALDARQKEVAGGPSGITSFDVANLAAGPSRVVSARIESERTL